MRGRGPVPALHVGAQPYGVLPVSDLHAWKPQAGETTEGVHRVVERLLDRWLQAARTRVPQVRAGRPNLDATMLDVLGSSPVMQGLRVRPLVSEDVSGAVEAAMGIGSGWFAAERQIIAAVAASVFGQHASRAVLGSLHKDTRPLPLPLVSERDPEFVAALLGTPSQVLAVDSVLQALLYLSWQSGDSDAAKASPAAVLPDLLEHVGLEAELTARTGALIARADDAHPDELFAIAAELGARAPLGGAAMLSAFQPVESLQTSLAEVALSAPVTDEARLVGVSALGGWFLAMGYRSELRTAMQSLVASDLEARRRAVAESLDCASHRLDAWATAVVSERRARQHGRGDEAGAGRGLTIGAWGVVEDLVPGAAAAPDGWIHAPTTRHAVTAGMLRSSHLSHLPSAGSDGGPFAIDLSSARARRAAAVLDGVRSGQQLAALVGYQIERGLAEAGLARLQLSLRTVAPLVARRLHDRDDADTDSARESVAATNVVDGLLLLKQHPPGDTTLRTRLDVPPDNAYLPAGAWKPMTDAEWDGRDPGPAGGRRHRRRGRRRDAERVGAAVRRRQRHPRRRRDGRGLERRRPQRHHRRAGGAGQRRAAHPPRAHRARRHPADERVEHDPAPRDRRARARGLGGGLPRDPPTTSSSPRSAGTCSRWPTPGLAALDLVFAEPTALDGVLRAALPGLGDAALAMTRQPAWPASRTALGETAALAGALRAVVAGAQPLLPGDLARPGTRPERDLAAALPELCARARSAAAALGAAVSAMAAQVHALPEDGVVADEAAAGAATALAHRLDPFGIPLSPEPARPLDVSWVRRAWESAEARAANAASTVARLDEAVAALAAGAAPATVLDAAQDVAAGVFGDGFLLLPVLEAPARRRPVRRGGHRPGVRAAAGERRTPVRARPRHGAAAADPVRRGAAAARRPRVAGPGDGRAAVASGWVTRPPRRPAPRPGWPGRCRRRAPGRRARWVTSCSTRSAASRRAAPCAGWPSTAGPRTCRRCPAPRPGPTTRGPAAPAPGWPSAPSRPRPGRRRPSSARSRPTARRWTTDALRAVVEQTLDLARIRMATLERLAGEGAVLPALYVRHGSLQGRRELVFTDLRLQQLRRPPVREGQALMASNRDHPRRPGHRERVLGDVLEDRAAGAGADPARAAVGLRRPGARCAGHRRGPAVAGRPAVAARRAARGGRRQPGLGRGHQPGAAGHRVGAGRPHGRHRRAGRRPRRGGPGRRARCSTSSSSTSPAAPPSAACGGGPRPARRWPRCCARPARTPRPRCCSPSTR